MKKKKGLVLGGILLLGIGFASISTTLYINGNVNISENTEDFNVVFTKAVVDSVDESSTVISEDGKTINYTTKELQALNDKSILDFEITNNSSLYDAEVSILCTSGEKGEYYQVNKEVANIIPAKTIDKGKIEVQKVKASTEDIEEAFTCTLTATAVERTTKDKSTPGINKNIVNSNVECLKNKEVGSCAPGTEIRYMVNDNLEKTFYVLHDDGDTMTLQQRENTVEGVQWYSADDNTKGPIVALDSLESATSGWSNVNNINYTMGTTNFNGTNAYTGCSSYDSCTENKYTLGLRIGKARMITIQEATTVGCTKLSKSCPVWMYNYLNGSINNGGTVNGTNHGYWTMNAFSTNSSRSWDVHYDGSVYDNRSTTDTNLGARAVIEINK